MEVSRNSTEEIKEEELVIEDSEQVIVKADPEDFNAGMEYSEENNDASEESGANRGIVVRNDLMRTPEATVVQMQQGKHLEDRFVPNQPPTLLRSHVWRKRKVSLLSVAVSRQVLLDRAPPSLSSTSQTFPL